MHLSWPIEPMLARPIASLPEAAIARGELVAEPKWDGWRVCARIDQYGSVSLATRHGNSISRAFPEIQAGLYDHLPAGIFDGELIRWADGDRLDFAMVSRRATASTTRRARELALRWPCHLLLFDVLEAGGRQLWREPFAVRRAVLETLCADIPGTANVAMSLQTAEFDEIEVWLEALTGHGIEGVVLKSPREPYRFGRRGWLKFKPRFTAEAVLAGVTGTADAPVSLLLGRYDAAGRLRMVGRTAPLSPAARAEIAAVITPSRGGHPWPPLLPAGWTGLYARREPLPYVRLEIELVVEVLLDIARTGDRWRHPVAYRRIRPDLRPQDVARLASRPALRRRKSGASWSAGAACSIAGSLSQNTPTGRLLSAERAGTGLDGHTMAPCRTRRCRPLGRQLPARLSRRLDRTRHSRRRLEDPQSWHEWLTSG